MNSANVEMVRRAWDLWKQGDLDRLFEFWDPGVVWDMSNFPTFPDRTYEGHDGVRRFLQEWREVWDSYEVGIDEMIELADGRVVVLAWQRGAGAHSGLEMEIHWGQINTFRNGRIVRIENYQDRSQALLEAGIER